MGLNFTGVDQDEEITRRRMRGREVCVIERDGNLIATVTLSVRDAADARHVYVSQVAVDPAEQRQGLGGRLMDLAETRARELGLDRVRLDTAIPATQLFQWYRTRGYELVSETHWEGKTYRSAILEKRL